GGTLAVGLTGTARPLAAAEQPVPAVPDHTLTVIAGKPRERGRRYGEQFKDAMHSFLDREIYQVCARHASRDSLLRYAGACGKMVQGYSPLVFDELEGIAEGSGLKLEEA